MPSSVDASKSRKLSTNLDPELLVQDFRKIAARHVVPKKRSRLSNVMTFTSSVVENIEKHQQVEVVYVDLSKAFDNILHDLAVEKLSRLGFSSWIVNWLKSYLSARKAYVKIPVSGSNVLILQLVFHNEFT